MKATKPKPSDDLTTAEFRKLVGNPHRTTISRWIRDGVIPPEAVRRTVTGRWIIKRWAASEVIE